MTARQKYLSVLILAMLFALTAGGGLAQEPETLGAPQRLPIIEGAVSSEFSYQGLLQEGGSPVTGSRDMIFRLHSNAACTHQVGSDINRPAVSIIDGYFDVSLDVDQADVNGQALWLEVRVGSTRVACQEIMPVPYALSLKPGAVISGDGTGIWAYSTDQYAFWGETESTRDYHTAVRGRATATTGYTRGVTGSSDSVTGIGVLGHANSETGLTYGVYGQTHSNSSGARGVYGYSSANLGNTYGVYGETDSTTSGAGGKFVGYTGVIGMGSGPGGYGGYFESAQNDGIRIGDANGDGIAVETADEHGISIGEANWDGLYIGEVLGDGLQVDRAGQGVYVVQTWHDGVHVTAADHHGVYAGTTDPNGEYGLYTPDKLWVGTGLDSGGPLMLIVQNGDASPLEKGDMVVAAGLGRPFSGSPSPMTLVRRAGSGGQPVAGVVYSHFVADETVGEQGHDGQAAGTSGFDVHSTGGAIAPGEYLLLCVLGPCQVKANAAGGAIQPGDALGVSAAPGTAALAPKLNLDGVAFYPPGVTFGTALDPLPDGSGLIHAFISTR